MQTYTTDNDLRLNEAHLRDLHRERAQRRHIEAIRPSQQSSSPIARAGRRRLGGLIILLGLWVGGQVPEPAPANAT